MEADTSQTKGELEAWSDASITSVLVHRKEIGKQKKLE